MNWLSREEIKRRAEISDEEALNVSIKEWEDKCKATRNGEFVRTGGIYCGLCYRHGVSGKPGLHRCSSCILYEDYEDRNCCREYKAFMKSSTLSNAQAMLNRLYLERGKRYGQPKKECKKEKPEIRHGDELFNPRDGRLFYALYTKSPHRAGSYENPLIAVNHEGVSCGNIKNYRENDFEKTGKNIFGDLKRNAEDLERFNTESTFGNGAYGGAFEAIICIGNTGINMGEDLSTFTFSDVEKISQKLLQMVATAKRREAKKDC